MQIKTVTVHGFLKRYVAGRFYRWSRNLSPRTSNYLAQDTWAKFRNAELKYLQPL